MTNREVPCHWLNRGKGGTWFLQIHPELRQVGGRSRASTTQMRRLGSLWEGEETRTPSLTAWHSARRFAGLHLGGASYMPGTVQVPHWTLAVLSYPERRICLRPHLARGQRGSGTPAPWLQGQPSPLWWLLPRCLLSRPAQPWQTSMTSVFTH